MDEKLTELRALTLHQLDDYPKGAGCATMPGQEEADDWVADECARLVSEEGASAYDGSANRREWP